MTHLGERPDYGQGALPFSAIPLPCGSALWAPDLTGRKSWRYSPESPTYVEGAFSEVRYSRIRGCPVTRGTPSGGAVWARQHVPLDTFLRGSPCGRAQQVYA